MPIVEDQELFAAAQRIGEIIFEHINSGHPGSLDSIWMRDCRHKRVNPYYKQTESGFFLEFFFGMPSKLWTPWGEWSISDIGSVYHDDVTPLILERLGATEYENWWGETASVYAVHCIDGVALPTPKVQKEYENYLDYDVATQAWDNMSRAYKK